mmetsp:Transcript_36608/g.104844  ORF Transcript_36608/g.104844 Transcript_36608/m.104844 type:complete len:225 (-) Transcript_36608:1429-2103(-)
MGRRGRCAAKRGTVPPQAHEQMSARAIVQLKRDLQEGTDKKNNLSHRYEELSASHRHAVERKKELQEAIRGLKQTAIPELSRDVLLSCESAADARAFGEKVRQEHQRLDQLYDAASDAARERTTAVVASESPSTVDTPARWGGQPGSPRCGRLSFCVRLYVLNQLADILSVSGAVGVARAATNRGPAAEDAPGSQGRHKTVGAGHCGVADQLRQDDSILAASRG